MPRISPTAVRFPSDASMPSTLKEKGLAGKIAVVGTVIPSQASPYLKDGSMQAGLLWNPADAGFGMVWIAKQMIDGKKIETGNEIPGIGKVTVEGRVVKADAMLDITKDNADSLGF